VQVGYVTRETRREKRLADSQNLNLRSRQMIDNWRNRCEMNRNPTFSVSFTGWAAGLVARRGSGEGAEVVERGSDLQGLAAQRRCDRLSNVTGFPVRSPLLIFMPLLEW